MIFLNSVPRFFMLSTQVTLAPDTTLCPTSIGAQIMSVTCAAGGATTLSCVDALGRSVREIKRGVRKVNGALTAVWIFVDYEFDTSGRARRASDPYFQGD